MGPLTETIASRTTVVEGRLVRLSQRDHRTALSANHSSIGLEGVSGQRRRSKWRVRPGQCLALPDLLPHELSRGQAGGLYQRSTGLRSMAHPKWLTAISFNLHRLQLYLLCGTVIDIVRSPRQYSRARCGGRSSRSVD